MGDYIRRCEKVGDVALMTVRTSSNNNKKRKIDSPQQLQSPSSNVQLQNSTSPPTSEVSDHIVSSLCPTNECKKFIKDGLRSSDLKAEELETEISVFINGRFSRENTPTSEFSEEMESLRRKKKSNMPLSEEIEEFFAVAEKLERKRFAEKYNYDIVKDVALEGRYQWVRLKP